MKKFTVLLVLVGLIAGLALTAFAKDGVEFMDSDKMLVNTVKYYKPAPWKIGFSNASISNSWRVFLQAHLQYEASIHPEIAEFFITDGQDNPTKQLADVEDLLAKGIDLLIIAPATDAALNPAVEKAMDKGVPVVVVDRKVTTEAYVTYIGSSDFQMGKIMADWLVEKLNKKGNVVCLSGVAGASPAEERLKGALDTFKKYPDIKVLEQQYCDWSPVVGKQVMATFIQKYPQIDGIWADSALQGCGAIEAVQEAGLPIPPVTGEDMNRYLKMWKQMKFDGVAVSFPSWQGQIAVQKAIDVLSGIPVPRNIDVPRLVITTDTLDKWVKMDQPDEYFMDSRLPEKWLPKR
ncbi:MAG: ABC transporter substrate-binding protein [Candidatus Atribacteria bacterium]|nr:ABC transporter substrate-binding protein [Candidatus Atribacteria bacterium]